MSLAAKETVGRVKMATEAEQMGVGAPWENSLIFWVNRVRRWNHDSADVALTWRFWYTEHNLDDQTWHDYQQV